MRTKYEVNNSRPKLSRKPVVSVGNPMPAIKAWSHQSFLAANKGKGIVVIVANQDYEVPGVLLEVDNFSILIKDVNGYERVIFKSAIESFHFNTELAK